ncbi:bifunctional hydroxymethylpyrimidine kinase/phosphomethylpyrimidine kinase [Salaquimonas pukyongi]|uniref:bifunctional hydroxymethylpyrimidine kinase/phosphomethylpyrimidine kinase n=1 Tax=Salaquimonas pukyongi TaxID=2712698 RepID=UPI00096BAEC5|nr:bifunctional hydroxymethylpyrimidine kinase/phosphomethylpyrimidine kinase [Salaquimonas pukyongi]
MSGPVPIALTIAGSDSGGGAGIQADLKAFSANRAYGASVITALTAQNTLGVSAIHEVPPEFVSAQIDAVFSDLNVAAVKVGMLASTPIIEAVAAGLRKWEAVNIVVDPVMVTTSGDPLIADEAVETLKGELFPLAAIVTPNLHEAARLARGQVAANRNEMKGQARAILAMGAGAVLMKGGHAPIEGDAGEAADVLVSRQGEEWFSAPRVETANTHGTGCSLSSAIAANLAAGMDLSAAVAAAKVWLTGALENSHALAVGKGAGPVHHFHNLWRKD